MTITKSAYGAAPYRGGKKVARKIETKRKLHDALAVRHWMRQKKDDADMAAVERLADQHDAAIKIQCLSRRRKANQIVSQAEVDQRERCATKIQGLERQRRARNQCASEQEQRGKEEGASVILQCKIRQRKAGKEAEVAKRRQERDMVAAAREEARKTFLFRRGKILSGEHALTTAFIMDKGEARESVLIEAYIPEKELRGSATFDKQALTDEAGSLKPAKVLECLLISEEQDRTLSIRTKVQQQRMDFEARRRELFESTGTLCGEECVTTVSRMDEGKESECVLVEVYLSEKGLKTRGVFTPTDLHDKDGKLDEESILNDLVITVSDDQLSASVSTQKVLFGQRIATAKRRIVEAEHRARTGGTTRGDLALLKLLVSEEMVQVILEAQAEVYEEQLVSTGYYEMLKSAQEGGEEAEVFTDEDQTRRERDATVKIQSIHRGTRGRKAAKGRARNTAVKRGNQERKLAVVRIQSVHRGRKERQHHQKRVLLQRTTKTTTRKTRTTAGTVVSQKSEVSTAMVEEALLGGEEIVVELKLRPSKSKAQETPAIKQEAPIDKKQCNPLSRLKGGGKNLGREDSSRSRKRSQEWKNNLDRSGTKSKMKASYKGKTGNKEAKAKAASNADQRSPKERAMSRRDWQLQAGGGGGVGGSSKKLLFRRGKMLCGEMCMSTAFEQGGDKPVLLEVYIPAKELVGTASFTAAELGCEAGQIESATVLGNLVVAVGADGSVCILAKEQKKQEKEQIMREKRLIFRRGKIFSGQHCVMTAFLMHSGDNVLLEVYAPAQEMQTTASFPASKLADAGGEVSEESVFRSVDVSTTGSGLRITIRE
jgi:hypothetical protein